MNEEMHAMAVEQISLDGWDIVKAAEVDALDGLGRRGAATYLVIFKL